MKREDMRIRDPFVFVENGRYYIPLPTKKEPSPKANEITLYESADLDDMECKRVIIRAEALAGYTDIWAPELHKYSCTNIKENTI